MQQDILLVNKNFKDINPLICGEEVCKPGHSFGPASREYYLLHYVFSGKGRYKVNGKCYSVAKGQIFIIHPYQFTQYEADSITPWHYCWIGFQCSLALPELLQNDVISVPEVEHIFHAMKESNHIEQAREFYICGKIYELFALLDKKNNRPQNKTYEYILKAKNYIDSNYVNQISVESIAASLNLDRSYFSTAFKKHTGKSPQRYIVDFRLEKAAELMAVHNYKPGEAALSAGYTDIFNFSKMFKRKFGLSPTEYCHAHNRVL